MGQFCIDQAAVAGVTLKTRKISGNCLEDIVAFAAQRPINSILSTENFTCQIGIVLRSWQDAIKEHFAKTLVAGAC
jgi:dTDP-4-dehydrorhamnose reductase